MAAQTNVVKLARVSDDAYRFTQFEFLYIPLDSLGNVVQPNKALILECWKHTGERRQHLYTASTLKFATMRMFGSDEFNLLNDVFTKINDPDTGIQWLTQVHRHPKGDIGCPKYTFPPRTIKEQAA